MQTRRLGQLVEAVHAVVYFAPEPQQRYAELGLRGYWRGYFASRTAALGPIGPEVGVAVLGGFAPSMVSRALPEVWATASPEQVLRARLTGATEALRRLGVDPAAAALTRSCVDELSLPGRPMAAAHAALPRSDDPLAALWLDCTVLREHRGDGHLAAVAALGMSWPAPHRLAAGRVDPRQQEHRGWDDETWNAATPTATAEELEDLTDRLAAPAFATVDEVELERLLLPAARAAAAELPFPNAMGLEPPG